MPISFHDHVNAATSKVRELVHYTHSDTDVALPQPLDLYNAISAAIDLTVEFARLIELLADRAGLMAQEGGLRTTQRGADPQQLLTQAERALRAASRPPRDQLDTAHHLVRSVGRKA